MHDNMTALECMDCGYTLSKDITGRTVEVMCPECKSYDVEIAITADKIYSRNRK
tara:strand:+ start:368 stop:529 length:162 start_codon:yes stop_codon:yes gene_type:complete